MTHLLHFNLIQEDNFYNIIYCFYYRYEVDDALLQIGIEQGRNLSALALPPGGKV